MSWDVYMYPASSTQEQLDKDEMRPVEVPHFTDGGTYVVGGTSRAELNVTYNYSEYFLEAGLKDGLRTLHNMRGKEALPLLTAAVKHLGTERDGDYWAATPGNAGAALERLRQWAELHPDGIFAVH